MKKNIRTKNNVQIVWGTALILVGVAVFFRIPQVMPQLIEMGLSTAKVWLIRIGLFIMGFLLVGGGIKKFLQYFSPEDSVVEKRPAAEGENGIDR